jgi:hypothetical protein
MRWLLHDKNGDEHFDEDGEEGLIADEELDNEPDFEAGHHCSPDDVEDADR